MHNKISVAANLDGATGILEDAVKACRDIIRNNVSTLGLAASVDNYPQVWARDTVITFMGGALSREPEMLDAFRISLEALGSHQDEYGQIPVEIRLADNEARYGSCDSTMWYVIGCCLYGDRSGNYEWLEDRISSVRQALNWCDMRDFTKNGLICSLEADDWADLLCHRGHVLFANSLLVWALNYASAILAPRFPAEAKLWTSRAIRSTEAIRRFFWVAPLGTFEDTSHMQIRAQMSIRLRKLPYFVSWISVFEFGERFDAPANLLSILAEVATPEQAISILDFIHQEGLDRPYPLHVIHPVIAPGERDWREYYMVWGHGHPYHYQNGGIWPWVGGLYVAALVKAGLTARAQEQLVSLAHALKRGKDESWECNEWLHGQSGNPMGAKYQAWSAGMFLFAHHCVTTGEVPSFNERDGMPLFSIKPQEIAEYNGAR
jgi:glycogen debranching enzyme